MFSSTTVYPDKGGDDEDVIFDFFMADNGERMKRYWSVYLDDELLKQAKHTAEKLHLSLNKFVVGGIEREIVRAMICEEQEQRGITLYARPPRAGKGD